MNENVFMAAEGKRGSVVADEGLKQLWLPERGGLQTDERVRKDGHNDARLVQKWGSCWCCDTWRRRRGSMRVTRLLR